MTRGSSEVTKGEGNSGGMTGKQKPPFRLTEDDTKPVLRDPIQRSDPIESEQAVLRLPPLPSSLAPPNPHPK
ncbi:hypothetical protein H6P81_004356 [Aristolochia fimbriata]|uniref:Uncharacterized protein n=1 Tax=Aristolochia fimbriata TaxID=158543 RepID=A0AAV7FFB6_ARIFI|nr:hypothetical protein H6P81_004356 [Aristolochia fimbriata]